MKLVRITLLLTMIAMAAAFPQKITKINRPYVLIDVKATSGITVGDKMNVVRQIGPGQTKDVGKVEIVVFKRGKCAGKIISETSRYPIRVGDQIQLQRAAAAPAPVKKKPAYQSASYQPKGNLLPTYIGLGAGLISFGIGYYNWNEAENLMKDFENQKLPDMSVAEANDKLSSYDSKTNLFNGVGYTLVGAGIAYYIWNKTTASSSLSSNIQLQPQYASNYAGMGLSFNFNHPRK